MAKQGRRTLTDRPVKKLVSIPSSVVDAVELRLLDHRGLVPYGDLSNLITKLLKRWIAEEGEKESPG